MSVTPTFPDFEGFRPRRTQPLSLKAALRSVQSAFLGRFIASHDNGDGFPHYVESARRAGVDVNDWIESQLGWVPARPILDQLVMPLIEPHYTVCEVGIGTGRWSRHIVPAIPDGHLVLVDKSHWIVNFARDYFRGSPNVTAVQCDGTRLPFGGEAWADLFFSQGMFITLRLGHVLVYLREFARCLRRGGHAVFDFVDPGTAEGWSFLQREAARAPDTFAYHRLETISQCCDDAGLRIDSVVSIGKSTYIVAGRV